MSNTGRYHGGLVFFGYEDTTLDRFSRIVSATLGDYGHPVERQSILNATEARITASHYVVKLTLGKAMRPSEHVRRSCRLDAAGRLNPGRTRRIDGPARRLEIKLCAADPSRDDIDISELLLVVMLYRLVDAHDVDVVEWLDPATVLTLEQFLSAFQSVSPRKVRGRQQIVGLDDSRFGAVGETETKLTSQYDAIVGKRPHCDKIGLVHLTAEESLALAFRTEPRPDELDGLSDEDERPNDIRRLATWGLTGMVCVLSAPVGASMAAVNLLRGEDFRLNTNVLSLTGLIVVLQSSGALASAVSLLPL